MQEDFLSELEKIKIEREFQNLDLAKASPEYEWRIRLNHALALESVKVQWQDDEGVAVIQAENSVHGIPGSPYIPVPIIHLDDLKEQDANPVAVAIYLKAVLFDPRFRLWTHEDEEE